MPNVSSRQQRGHSKAQFDPSKPAVRSWRAMTATGCKEPERSKRASGKAVFAGYTMALQLHSLFDSPSAKDTRSEEHTSELQSLMRISYAVFCLKKNNKYKIQSHSIQPKTT